MAACARARGAAHHAPANGINRQRPKIITRRCGAGRPITSGGPRRELRPLRRPLRRALAIQVVARIPPGARHALAAHASCAAAAPTTSDGGRACTAGHLWAGRATSPPRERRPARARAERRPPAPVPRQRGSARRARRVVRVARQAIHVATYCDLPPSGGLRHFHIQLHMQHRKDCRRRVQETRRRQFFRSLMRQACRRCLDQRFFFAQH